MEVFFSIVSLIWGSLLKEVPLYIQSITRPTLYVKCDDKDTDHEDSNARMQALFPAYWISCPVICTVNVVHVLSKCTI